MNTLKVNRISYVDILFLNWNKEYGSYILRTSYHTNAIKALLIPLALLLAIVFYSAFISTANIARVSESTNFISDSVILVHIDITPKIQIEDKTTLTLPKRKTKLFAAPVIVDKSIDPLHKNNIVDSLLSADIGAANSNDTVNNLASDMSNPFGNESKGDQTPSLNSDKPSLVNEDKIVEKFDRKAVPPKGFLSIIKKYLRYPDLAKEAGLSGQAIVSFIVEIDGRITNVTIAGQKLGGGLDEEAVRVVKLLPNWEPALLQGEKVHSYYKLPIVFNLRGQ